MSSGRPVVAVDDDRCLGTGLCTFYAAHTFDIGDEGTAVVLDPAGDGAEELHNAVEACPARAIRVIR